MVEVGGLESHLLAPPYVAGLITVLAQNACGGGGYSRFAFIKRNEGNECGGSRRALLGAAGSHRVHEREAQQADGDSGAKAKIDERSPEEIRRTVLQDVLVLQDKISEVEIELLETSQ